MAAAASLRMSSSRMMSVAPKPSFAGIAQRGAAAPRRTMGGQRWYTESPKAKTTGPTSGSPPPPLSSRATGTSTMLMWSAPALALAAGAFLYLSRDDKKETLGVGSGGVSKLKGSKHNTGATLSSGGGGIGGPPMKGGNSSKVGVQPDGTKAGSKADYQEVYNAIASKLDKDENYDDGSYGPVLVRLAWHASGTYDKKTGTGGSNGATMRFAPEANHGANAGLIHARNFMDEIHQQFPWITYSDLWTLGGVVAVQELGGPKVPWRPGRSDREEQHCAPDGRLPDGDKSHGHLRDIFYRMGFNDQEIVALSGAHALGRCHSDRSGFEGPWQHSPTSFNNEYFNLLLSEPWEFKKWDGPKQYVDKATKGLMMLTTDMALVEDKSFKKHVDRYAKDESVFFKEFASAFSTLLELGVPQENFENFEADHSGQQYVLKTTAEQENSS